MSETTHCRSRQRLLLVAAVLIPRLLQAGPPKADTGLPPRQSSVTAPSATFISPDGTLNLKAVVKHFEDLYRADSSIAETELTVVRPRRTRSLRMKIWTRGEEKALVLIQAPPREKGTATLKVNNNLWNYLPRIRRTIRIPPSMMLSSWMGSDFTNDDLVRESSYSEDYDCEVAGRSEEPAGWLIRFTAREGVVGLWKSFELIMSPDATTPLQSKWYNRKGELARVLTWDKMRVLDGRRLPTRMTLVPTDRSDKGWKTVMEYHNIDFDVQLPESRFSLSNLERQR